MTAPAPRTARHSQSRFIDQVTAPSRPVQIVGKLDDAVSLTVEERWALRGTICLVRTPDLRKSIRNAMSEPLSKSVLKLHGRTDGASNL